MNSRLMPLSEIKPNPDNPRIIKDEKFAKLVKSIKEFPEMLKIRPLVVNADMVVLGGNMRLKACQAAGLSEVPVILASGLTPEQQREFIIKDNVGFGEWDWDTLGNEWEPNDLIEWGLDIPWINQAVADEVNKGDESSEWIGMPDFEVADKAFKLTMHFENDEARHEFCKLANLVVGVRGTQTWSTWWPAKAKNKNTQRYE